MRYAKAFISLLLIAMLAMVSTPALAEAEPTATLPDGACTLQGDWNNDDAFEGYLRGMMGLEPSDALYASRSLGGDLTGVNKALYDKLKALIANVAAGKLASTVFGFSTTELGIDKRYTASELGVKEIITSSGTISTDAMNAMSARLNNTIDLNALALTLLHDCPYELYWCDKDSPIQWSKPVLRAVRGSTTAKNTIYFGGDTTFSFRVASDYSKGGNYSFNTSLAAKAKAAAKTAKAIVRQYADAGDYAKLYGYKNAICEMTDYNRDTASSKKGATNPWQLIWVFDGDESTKVVSKGYTKAFQYLCDMTDFSESGIYVYSVTGAIKSPYMIGDHTWNIIHINGKNYIADITNCDTYANGSSAIGAPDKLFMKAPTKGSAAKGYSFKPSDTATYTYSKETTSLFSGSELTLAKKGYLDEVVPVDALLFPDDAFRACIASKCDANGDGYLYESEIKAATSLNVSGKSIASLKGIERLPALKVLNCSNNSLTELDVSENPKLQKLTCHGNALTSLDISKCPKLVAVVKAKNRVSDAARYYKEGSAFVKYDAGVRLSMGAAALTLPKKATAIGEEAFMGIGARAVVLPAGVTSIGPRAFSNCVDLMEIVIPKTVNSIADDAFAGSANVLIVSNSKTIRQWAKDHDIDCAAM